jgi:streptogramin lyase
MNTLSNKTGLIAIRKSMSRVAFFLLMMGAILSFVLAGSAVTLTSRPASAASHPARDGQTRDHGEDDDVSLYVSSDGTDSVLAYDGETGAFERKFARRGGLIEPEGIAFGPDGNLYVSSRSDEVLRYDGETGKFIDVFASGHGLVDPAGIAFRLDGLLYVISTPDVGPGEVLRFDPADNSFVDKFVPEASSAILDPTGLVFGPDGDLFLSSAATSEVKRYDGTTGTLKGVFITAGLGGLNEAEGMAFGPNGNLSVASELGNAVLEYDDTTGAFVGEFVAAGSGRLSEPTFIICGPSEE